MKPKNLTFNRHFGKHAFMEASDGDFDNVSSKYEAASVH